MARFGGAVGCVSGCLHMMNRKMIITAAAAVCISVVAFLAFTSLLTQPIPDSSWLFEVVRFSLTLTGRRRKVSGERAFHAHIILLS